MLPNHRLLARAFHRLPSTIQHERIHRARRLSSTTQTKQWEGRKAEENTVREKDTHNVQQDASREGKASREAGDGGTGTTEKAGGKGQGDLNKKAKEDHPEAPGPVIGMNDERGGTGS